MSRIRLVSADLNGTLVRPHTMSDMIRQFVGDDAYRTARAAFDDRLAGKSSIEQFIGSLGPPSRGITLRQAIEYADYIMEYLPGYRDLIAYLHENAIPLLINSTGYSVTMHVMRHKTGSDKIHGLLGNRLLFGYHGDPGRPISETELERLIGDYFGGSDKSDDHLYDTIAATGEIELDIVDESKKTEFLRAYLGLHFPDIGFSEVMHLGDTMGDSRILTDIAEAGGIAVAFNYNDALKDYLENELIPVRPPGKIHLIDAKSSSASLVNVIKLIE